ncbi:MAG TPA: hypothetical protein VN704_10590 [Verrucomicrobiae bacterium]|nr:hypothetical protein [Verrucomicrobiae bacterium]
METKNNPKNNDNSTFNAIYEQAINESLLIFGEQIATVISLHIKEKCVVTKLGDTVENPKIFSEALEDLLDSGSNIIKRRILRLLYQRIGIEQTFVITINFEEKVLRAKKEFEKKFSDYNNS